MRLKRPLYGPDDPRGPSHGRDVKDFVKRTLRRLHGQIGVGQDFFNPPVIGHDRHHRPIYGKFDDIYNAKTAEAVTVVQQWYQIKPHTGHMGVETFDILWAHADAYSRWVYLMWNAPKPKPKPPVIIAPVQGLASLDKSLWEAFSIGRGMGLSDLGTFNPSSRLPSGAPSDHAVWPAMAFDLGISPDNGYANPAGNAFFKLMIGRPEIEYVILGNRIWSRSQGLHAYTGGNHDNHVHTSGNR